MSKPAEILSGRVVGVTDGDTITVSDQNHRQHKARLAGVDAPERKQAFGNSAKQHLSYSVFNKWATVEYSKRDRYGRIVGKVWVATGDACPSATPECPGTLDAGLAVISAGLAWHYKQYEREQREDDRHKCAAAEKAAYEKRVGLWNDVSPIAPWLWRKAPKPE